MTRRSPIQFVALTFAIVSVGLFGCGGGDSTTTIIKTTAEPESSLPLCDDVLSGDEALDPSGECLEPSP